MQPTTKACAEVNAGSITIQLAALKNGDANAQEWLFARLLPQVVGLAKRRIGRCPSRYHDEYDVATEVLAALLMQSSTFERLQNRTDLACLLERIVKYKSVDAYRRMRRRQRMEVGESWAAGCSNRSGGGRRFLKGELSQDMMQIMAQDLFDSLIHSIRRLRDNELQCGQVLKLLVEGYSVAEISQVVGRGERSIYRLLKRIEREFSTSINS